MNMEKEKTILRVQFNGKMDCWRLVQKTYNGSGGWKKFGNEAYASREAVEKVLDTLVSCYPEMYEKEK